MSYVPGFASDVFVSYSTIDNEVLVNDGGQKRGWVDMLLDRIRMEMKARLGGREVRFAIDHEIMRANRPITPQLLGAVRSSATLLIILSPSYLASDWCRRERNAFLAMVPDRVATGSVLVARVRPVDEEDLPHELRDLGGIELFTTVPGAASHRLLGYPSPDDDRLFADRILTLSGELAEELQHLRAATKTMEAQPRSRSPATTPPIDSPGAAATSAGQATTAEPMSVFLCSAAADVALRDDLLKHLAPLVGHGDVTIWHSGMLQSGDVIRQETMTRVEKAAVVLALATPDLLDADDCLAQVDRALRLGIRVVPVLARPCALEYSALAGLSPLPSNGKPVSTWADRDAAWADVVRGVVRGRQRPPSAAA